MSAPSLRDSQRWMKGHIRPEPSVDTGGASLLNPQGTASGLERLSIYADAYVARIHEALTEIYEAVKFVVGERKFFELSWEYAKEVPSREYNLSLTGKNFPQFLAAHRLTASLPLLPDLARLEWAVAVAFCATEEAAFDAAVIAALPQERLQAIRFRFQPAVSAVSSNWPILDIWQARKGARESVDIPLEGRPQPVLIYRAGLNVRCELLLPEQAVLLGHLIQGEALERALSAASRNTATESLPVEAWFSRWMQLGLIAGYSF